MERSIALSPRVVAATAMEEAVEEEAMKWMRSTGREWVMAILKKKKKVKGGGLGLGLGLGCLIYPFGSYALGVPEEDEEDDGDDVSGGGIKKKKKMKNADLLCVGPSYVKPGDLILLQDILLSKQEEDDGLISDVCWLPHHLVPRMEFTFRRLIHVHILYASIAAPFIPHDLDICDDISVLRNADLSTVAILDCCRTVSKLLRLVPHPHNFRAALLCLKLWAKRRAVYSNALGFLGDVSWALLLARICIDHPDAAASTDTILPLFFRAYRAWRWPHPLLICPIQDHKDLAFPSWNPQRNPLDALAPMPIITPAYPCMNSSPFVSTSTRQIITQQFEAASRVCDLIHLGKADWTLLFQPYPFFQAYDYYLEFTTPCCGDSRPPGGDSRDWKTPVEHQLRMLALCIEHDLQGALQCHPYPNVYATDDAAEERVFFVGLRWDEGLSATHMEFELARLEFTLDNFLASLELQGTRAYVSCVHRDSIPSFVFADDYDDDEPVVNREMTTTSTAVKKILKRKRSAAADAEYDANPPPAKRASTRTASIQEAVHQVKDEMAAAARKQRKRTRALLYESGDDTEELIPAAKKLAGVLGSLTIVDPS